MAPTMAKRVHESSMTFITLEAESPQVVRVKDVEPPKESGWRAGLNRTVEDLPKKSQDLVIAELARFPVEVGMQDTYGHGLFAARAFKENEVVCSCSVVWFDSAARLQEMLNSQGNMVFIDRLIRVDKMDLTANTSSQPIIGSVFGALVGVGGYFNHWGNIRRGGPNVVFRVNPSKGFGDTLVEAVVRTRNGVGIAVKQALVINYGLEYDFAAVTAVENSDQATKKFKGALDKFLGIETEGKAPPILAPPSDMPSPKPSTPKKQVSVEVAANSGASSGAMPSGGMSPGCMSPGGVSPADHSKPSVSMPITNKPQKPPDTASPIMAPPSMQPGDQPLGVCMGSDIGPDKLELWLDNECLRLKSSAERNVKCMPNTILAVIRQGDLKKDGDDNGIKWALTQPKKDKVFLLKTSKPKVDVSGLKTVSVVIEETKATKLSFHGEWAKDKIQTIFAPKAKASFVPTTPDQLKLSVLARKLSSVALVWILKLDGDKLCPWGVALVNPKQVIVMAGSTYQLQ